ncbi:MAG: 2-C-methyl-D-erythritol 4-phosphate cytidylyltransferase [Bacteroidales bacterium]|nr:2-C-methyl-D-erythritol 4-phosphate cytidylyltransferase [Bacteroidales bacterium]
MNKYVVIVAAGKGDRMKSENPKQFIEANGKPLLMYTIEKFYQYDHKILIIVVLPAEYINFWEKLCKIHGFNIKHKIVKGGKTRFQSSLNGINAIHNDGIVAIHDGVRPCISYDTIKRCFETTEKYGNAIPCVPIIDSMRKVENEKNYPVDRRKYYAIQTPQTFRVDLIKEAYKLPYKKDYTDDAMVFEANGHKINLVEGNIENIKITTNTDLIFIETLLKSTI